MAPDREQTLALIQEKAKISGVDRFKVIIFRRLPSTPVPQKVAGLDGATFAHVAEPSAWLPALLGGGEYTLNVYHSVDQPGSQLGSPLVESYDTREGSPAGTPKATPSLKVMGAPEWPGPSILFFPSKALYEAELRGQHPLAQSGTPRQQLNPFVTNEQGVPSGETQGILARALSAEAEAKRLGEETARRERDLNERSARMEKENTEKAESIKRQESEAKLREEMRTREAALNEKISALAAAAQNQRPVEAPRGPSVTEIIQVAGTVLGPIFTAMIEASKETARATREAAEKNAQSAALASEKNHAALMEVLKAQNAQKPGMSEEMKMLLGVLQEDKKSTSADAMAAMMTRMVDAVGVVSKMSIGMIETVAQQLGGDPEDPVVVAIREGTKAMQMLSQGAQAGAARSIPAVRQQPPAQPAQQQRAAQPQPQQQRPQQQQPRPAPAGAVATGPQQPPVVEVPVATPAPIGVTNFAEVAPAPPPSSVDLVKNAIIGQQDPTRIASALVKLIKEKEPVFVTALRAAGTPDELLVQQLGQDFVLANSDYLNQIGRSFEEQGEAAGIFEDGEPAPVAVEPDGVPAT